MATCSNGHDNPDGQQYCGDCGAPLRESDSAASSPVSSASSKLPRSPGHVTLAEEIVSARDAAGPTATEPVSTSRVPAERMTRRVAVCILTVLSAQFLAFGLVEAWTTRRPSTRDTTSRVGSRR
jgi:hypothetical protein